MRQQHRVRKEKRMFQIPSASDNDADSDYVTSDVHSDDENVHSDDENVHSDDENVHSDDENVHSDDENEQQQNKKKKKKVTEEAAVTSNAKKTNPKKYRQCSPDSNGDKPFTFVTATDEATHLYAVPNALGKPSGAFSISPIACAEQGVTTGVALTISIKLKPKNHMKRLPKYPCLGCGVSFLVLVREEAHPCVMTGPEVKIFGHLCAKCYKIMSRGYYCVLLDNIVVLTAFTDKMKIKWKESCKSANQFEHSVTNPFYAYKDHHPDWFKLTDKLELMYIGKRTLPNLSKLMCMHGASARMVSQQYIAAFPPKTSCAVKCDGQNILTASNLKDAERDKSSYIQHRFAPSPFSLHGPFPNVHVTKYGVVVASGTIRSGDIIYIDYGFAHFWQQVHGVAMPPTGDAFDDRAYVTTVFPNDVTKLEPKQFMRYLSRRIPATIWNDDMRCLLSHDAASLREFVLDAKTVLSDVQYGALCAMLPASFFTTF